MEKVQKLVNWRLVAIVTITLLVSIYFTMASGTKLYVNGTEVATSKGQTFVKNGKTYVPLEAVIKGMGDKYSWNRAYRTANIQKANGQKINVTNGKSVAKIGYKFVPLSTKKVGKATVSSGHKALMINNIIYVPVDFVQSTMGYPVKIAKEGTVTKVYIGKLPQTKPVATKPAPKPVQPAPKPTPKPVQPAPKPTPTPAPAPSSSLNKDAVLNSLASQGFFKHTSTLVALNIYNVGGNGGGEYHVAVDLTNDSGMYLIVRAWNDPGIPESAIIPGKVKSALNQIIPSGANHIYNIVNATAQSGTHSELNKVFTYDGLKTKVTFSGGGSPELRVTFSK